MFDEDGPTLLELAKQALSSTRGGYDLLATKFDKTPFRTPDEIIDKALRAALPKDDKGEIAHFDAALDLCCGTGAGLAKLRPLCKKRLVGLDFSPKMLEEAARKLDPKGGFGQSLSDAPALAIDYVEQDVFSMSFDKEFDVITCFGAFGHILPEAEPRFIDLVRRALRPGGKLVFVTAFRPKPYLPRAILAHGFNAVMRARNAFWSPPFIMYYLTFLLPEVERLLQWKGFSVEKHHNVFGAPFDSLVVVAAERKS